jgi:hypothetical protein
MWSYHKRDTLVTYNGAVKWEIASYMTRIASYMTRAFERPAVHRAVIWYDTAPRGIETGTQDWAQLNAALVKSVTSNVSICFVYLFTYLLT